MSDRELQEFASALDLSALEEPVERQFDSVRKPSDTFVASLGRSVGASPVEESASPSSLREFVPVEGQALCQSATCEVPTKKVAECVPTVKG